MKIVIDIPEGWFYRLQNEWGWALAENVREAIKHGTPLPETGQWIETDEWRETVDGFEQWGYFRKCNKCGYVFKFLEIDNYCPNCGTKMSEISTGSESEAIE